MAIESISSNAIEYYRWDTPPTDTCPLCQRLDGEIMSREEWSAFILPGYHPGCLSTLQLSHTLPADEAAPASSLLIRLSPHLQPYFKSVMPRLRWRAVTFFVSVAQTPCCLTPSSAAPRPPFPRPHLPGGGVALPFISLSGGKSNAHSR